MTPMLECGRCQAHVPLEHPTTSCACGGLYEVRWPGSSSLDRETLRTRRAHGRGLDASGVWLFRERVLACPEHDVVTHPEGRTRLYTRGVLSAWAGVDELLFKHEGENPTGSFKDRGMTVAVTQAKRLGARMLACASTGNTSASLAAYAAHAGLPAVVFLPAGKVSSGKLAQTVAYGAHCLAVRGDFDAALRLAREAARSMGVTLVNSVNPFRLEGQKTIVWELLADLDFDPPDWIVVPGGNLGNTSAFGKALVEAHALGWIPRLPRLLTVQAAGASPFYRSARGQFARLEPMRAETVATAIRIGDPVNHERAVRAIQATHGDVEVVTDGELLEAKSAIDRAGIGCEPASATTLAAVRKRRQSGTFRASDRIVCVLTGHVLKDPDVLLSSGAIDRAVREVDATPSAIEGALRELERSGRPG